MNKLKYFKSEFNTQGRRGENDDVTAIIHFHIAGFW